MGVITLTDRISVTVREKSSSGGTGGGGGSTAGGRDTASRLAETLGVKDLTDEELDGIAEAIDNAGGKSGKDSSGARTGRSIIDEQNREWLPIESVIAAGKRMQENGAFKTKEVHDGMTDSDGTVYGAGMTTYPVPILGENKNGNKVGVDGGGGQCCFYGPDFYGYYGVCIFSTENTWYHIYRGGSGTFDDTLSSESATIAGVKYSFFRENISDANLTKEVIEAIGVTASETYPSVKDAAAYLFGSTHEEANSLIDWTAPNAEIERQLKQHYDTFDPTDHDEGADGMWAGGYVLAGPLTALNEGN